MYKLIINGKLYSKVLSSLDELLLELSKLDQIHIYSLNFVKVCD